MGNGIKIPVEAVFNKGSEQQALQQFQQQFNALGEKIASLNKLKFQPIDKASIDHLRQVNNGFNSLLKVSGDLRKRLGATGQKDAGLFDVDWSKLYPDASSRSRQMHKVFEYVSGGSRFQPLGAAPGGGGGGPGGGGGGGGGGGRPPPAPPEPPSNGRRILQAGLNASGFGGPAAAGMGDAAKFGLGAGIAGLVGGFAALAVGKLIGEIREKVGNAQQELIGFDTMKRVMGDVNVSFVGLKDSVRQAARGLDVNFDEGQRLAMQFAKTSGMHGSQSRQLGEDVMQSGGFARSFGLDPSQGAGFFGQMRMNRVTNSTDDSRRLGLLIGEGVARAGAFSKMDEVLEAVAGFVSNQTRQSMNVANAGGFMGFLSAAMGSGIPGTDPAGAAALLGKVNAGIAGGAGGEAGQNFMFTALGSRLGLNPIQSMLLREQGAFGTGAGTFGPGSTYSKFAEQNGLDTPGQAAGSKATNLQLVMEQLKKVYAGRPELMVNAMSSLFGVNNSQAMALATVHGKYGGGELGGLESRLKRLGVNIGDVNDTGISRLAQLEADGTLSESDKDSQIKSAAAQNQVETEGSRTRATIAGVERAVQSAATLLVGPLNDIRGAVMFTAGEGGKRSPREIMEAMARAEGKDRVSMINGEMDPQIRTAYMDVERLGAQKRSALTARGANAMQWSPEQLAENAAKISKLTAEEAAAQQKLTQLKGQLADRLEEERRRTAGEVAAIRTPQRINPAGEDDFNRGGVGYGRGRINPGMPAGGAGSGQYDSLFAEAGQQYGIHPALLKAIARKESNLNPEAIGGTNANGTTDYGLMQHNSRYLAERGLDGDRWKDPKASIMAGAKLLRGNLDATGNMRDAVRRYNGSGPMAERYADDVMGRYSGELHNWEMSAAERERSQQAQRTQEVNVSGTFHLNGPNGQPAAAPVTVATARGVPQPAGATR